MSVNSHAVLGPFSDDGQRPVGDMCVWLAMCVDVCVDICLDTESAQLALSVHQSCCPCTMLLGHSDGAVMV